MKSLVEFILEAKEQTPLIIKDKTGNDVKLPYNRRKDFRQVLIWVCKHLILGEFKDEFQFKSMVWGVQDSPVPGTTSALTVYIEPKDKDLIDSSKLEDDKINQKYSNGIKDDEIIGTIIPGNRYAEQMDKCVALYFTEKGIVSQYNDGNETAPIVWISKENVFKYKV